MVNVIVFNKIRVSNYKMSNLYFTYGLTSTLLCIVVSKNLKQFIKNVQPMDSPVKVTAVFINCDIDDTEKKSENEDTRFEREELFKHNALQNCDKKLALTIRLTSTSATVRGLLALPNENSVLSKRAQRSAANSNTVDNWRLGSSYTVEPVHAYPAQATASFFLRLAGSALSVNSDNKIRMHPAKRIKRHEKNVIIEGEDITSRKPDAPESQFLKLTNNDDKNDQNKNHVLREVTDSNISEEVKLNEYCKPGSESSLEANNHMDNPGKEFALYEIGNPMLLFEVHVHLFEKLSTFKGNTLWNDITKGVPISLSSASPEWRGPDMNLHYKPVHFVARDDFLLPKSSLCLLIPLLEEQMEISSLEDANYILIPSEDVLDIDKTHEPVRTSNNISAEDKREFHRKVVVRVARALNKEIGDKLNVVRQASDKFLTTRHYGVHQAQVDLEARADDNQLVQVSVSGRIAVIVAENTRGTRSMLTVQATNTGLFVVQFRAQLRDCDSDLLKLIEKQDEGITSEPVSLPPRHTRRLRLRLRLPSELPAYLHHCSGDNPSFPCREMSAARQGAAGLPLRLGARYSRACSYADVTSINIAVVVIGVIGMLLFLGALKGLVGLVWPGLGVWGLDCILEEPRSIGHYFERRLRDRKVVYDAKGWPVHPDTLKRTVRVVSLSVEFILNLVFFVVIPGLVAVNTLKYLSNCKPCHEPTAVAENDASRRPNVTLNTCQQYEVQLLPLSHDGRQPPQVEPGQTSESDSDQEDTAFVLMRMQQSSESLARNQIEPEAFGSPRDTGHGTPLQPDKTVDCYLATPMEEETDNAQPADCLYETPYVKEEALCVDSEEQQASCSETAGWGGASTAAMLAGLYADHTIKDELVLGPEVLHRQNVTPVFRG